MNTCQDDEKCLGKQNGFCIHLYFNPSGNCRAWCDSVGLKY